MSEERTMSTVTKLSSPDRGSQHVSTLIDMATIRQHYRREEISSLRSFRPTVRFAELPSSVEAPAAQTNEPGAEMPHPGHQVLRDATEYLGELVRQQDPPVSQYTTSGQSDSRGTEIQSLEIESNDGVSLSSNLLTNLLSDRPVLLSKQSCSPELPLADAMPPAKRQKIDVSALEY
ncbi:hypothetical protein FRC07_008716 [Ceratobasidium sp. 392]|nr:hypothetical protein FRC07_008716 [Ceratobasidium sp. 392]